MKSSTQQHEISMGYRIDHYTPEMSRASILRAMLVAVRNGTGALPLGLSVNWTIRGKEWDFAGLVRMSNSGIRKLMERRIARDLEAL